MCQLLRRPSDEQGGQVRQGRPQSRRIDGKSASSDPTRAGLLPRGHALQRRCNPSIQPAPFTTEPVYGSALTTRPEF